MKLVTLLLSIVLATNFYAQPIALPGLKTIQENPYATIGCVSGCIASVELLSVHEHYCTVVPPHQRTWKRWYTFLKQKLNPLSSKAWKERPFLNGAASITALIIGRSCYRWLNSGQRIADPALIAAAARARTNAAAMAAHVPPAAVGPGAAAPHAVPVPLPAPNVPRAAVVPPPHHEDAAGDEDDSDDDAGGDHRPDGAAQPALRRADAPVAALATPTAAEIADVVRALPYGEQASTLDAMLSTDPRFTALAPEVAMGLREDIEALLIHDEGAHAGAAAPRGGAGAPPAAARGGAGGDDAPAAPGTETLSNEQLETYQKDFEAYLRHFKSVEAKKKAMDDALTPHTTCLRYKYIAPGVKDYLRTVGIGLIADAERAVSAHPRAAALAAARAASEPAAPVVALPATAAAAPAPTPAPRLTPQEVAALYRTRTTALAATENPH